MARASGAAPGTRSATPGSDATITAKAFTVEPGKVGDATVQCPAGKRVVGGGVGQTGPTATLRFGVVQASGPVDETGQTKNTDSGDIARGWSASVFNRAGGMQREYRVYAICSSTSDATIEATRLSLADNVTGQATATCPAGRRALGGGVGLTDGTSPVFGTVQSTGPQDETGQAKSTESGDTARSWYALVYNYNGAHEYRVFALCSADSDATIEAKAFSVDSGQAGDAIAQCSPGKRALDGGVIAVDGPGYLASVQQSGPVDETGQTASTTSGDVARSWFVSLYAASKVGFRVFAICASDAPTPRPRPTVNARCASQKATIVGTAAPDTIKGTAGVDVIAGLGGNDTIAGLGGNDTICGGAGNDILVGGLGNDHLFGDAGEDDLSGGPGNDFLRGYTGNDDLVGGPGNDNLVGGPGVDKLSGGPGQNTLIQ